MVSNVVQGGAGFCSIHSIFLDMSVFVWHMLVGFGAMARYFDPGPVTPRAVLIQGSSSQARRSLCFTVQRCALLKGAGFVASG